MPTCFTIQPFDSGKFDKRFDDVFAPALEDAGLEPYRVDRDPHVDTPIDAIEEGIRDAVICLADITTDNPNVWYELGFAYAIGRPVILVCSNERTDGRFPFDIQHRAITVYNPESTSDFDILRKKITERAKALLTRDEVLKQIREVEQIAPQDGLSQGELVVLAILAGDSAVPEATSPVYSLKHDAERAGLTAIGFGLSYRRLQKKGLVETEADTDQYGDSIYFAKITDVGWDWVESNEALFTLRKPEPKQESDSEIPF